MRFVVAGMFAIVAVGCATGGPSGPVFQSGHARAELQLNAADNGRTIGVEVGQVFTITLPVQQPDWAFTTTPDQPVTSLVSHVTSGNSETWEFRANGPGTTDLQLDSGAPEPFHLIVSVT
jgi:hypothetical protein